MTLWTVGHGKRSSQELLTLLRDAQVECLIDVRRYPGSRRNPQFGQAALAHDLSTRDVEYQWWGHALGGRRRPLPDASRHPAWREDAFRGYADHMDGPEFRAAFSQLLALAGSVRSAVLCSETLWWRCHRRLLSDAAVLAGTPVVHLMTPGRSDPHRLHPAVRPDEDGWPVYDVLPPDAAEQPRLL